VAGSSMTFTYDDGRDGLGRPCGIRKITVDWTSDSATGAVSGTTCKIVGQLIKAVTDPGAAAPDANYDIAITDPEGVDVLSASEAALANRHTANTEEVYFYREGTVGMVPTFPVVCDPLTIAVTAAGNSKNGQIIIYYRPL
jgi:hypothetical protein